MAIGPRLSGRRKDRPRLLWKFRRQEFEGDSAKHRSYRCIEHPVDRNKCFEQNGVHILIVAAGLRRRRPSFHKRPLASTVAQLGELDDGALMIGRTVSVVLNHDSITR